MTTAVLAVSHWALSDLRLKAFAFAAVAVALMLVVIAVAAKDRSTKPISSRWFFGQLIGGADLRLSTSKCQAVIWTIVAIFAFVEVFIERYLLGVTMPDSTIPTNMLIAMGFSVATMTAAKGITVSYVASGLVNKSAPTTATGVDANGVPTFGGLVTDDDGVPDSSKIQMLAFTMLAVVVYIVRMALPDVNGPPELTDIEPALMVLMGLSHGAYLGKKLTTTETPRVIGISPQIGDADIDITLSGANFGDDRNGSTVQLDGVPVPDVGAWTDSKIVFKVPAERQPTLKWSAGDRASVAVVVNGRRADAPVQFVFKKASA